MVNYLSNEAAKQQKLDIEVQLAAYNWTHRLDIACAISDNGEMGNWCRSNWGSSRPKSFKNRSEITRSFIRRAVKRLNRRARDKHYPYLYVHEPKYGLENEDSWHVHVVLCNRTGFDDTQLLIALEHEALNLRKQKGLDVYCQLVAEDGNVSNYLGKFMNYSKDVDRSIGMLELIRNDERYLRNVRCNLIEKANEVIARETACLFEKHRRRYPYRF